MKNPAQERLRIQIRQYHRNHPWHLKDGLFVPHAYPESLPELSWWDDVGFILNGRRVMVWWVHPRMRYEDQIGARAWQEAGDPPGGDSDLFGPREKQWKKVGRSRKKVVSYRTMPPSEARRDHYAKFRAIKERMESEGIDFVVRPSISIQRLSWCIGVELCLPIEVRNRQDMQSLAGLARRLVRREVTLTNEFPEYQYRKQDWLAESDARNRDRENRCQTGS